MKDVFVPCGNCSAGFVIVRGMVASCSCLREFEKRRMQDARKEIGRIPTLYKDASLSSFMPGSQADSTVVQYFFKYLALYKSMFEKGVGIFLSSSLQGNGKKHLVLGLLNDIPEDIPVGFIQAVEYIEDIFKTWDHSGRVEPDWEWVEYVKSVNVLCIADLNDTVFAKMDSAKDIIHKLLIHRYSYKRPTFITSNMDSPLLCQVAGPLGSLILQNSLSFKLDTFNMQAIKRPGLDLLNG